jgi:hypothetical protein
MNHEEVHMRRVFGVFVGALLLSALPAFAQADKPAAKADKPAKTSSKTMTANGTVSAVSADSLTVKEKTGDVTFAVDSTTKVEAKGASHKTAAMKDDKKTTQVTDFVHVGDTVSVRYHDMGDKKHAATVTVRSAAAPAK